MTNEEKQETLGEPQEPQEPVNFKDTGVGGIFEDVEQRDLEQVKDKDLVVKDFKSLPSQFGGDFAVVLAESEGKDVTFPVGSKVIQGQLQACKDKGKMPFRAKIVERESKAGGRKYQTFE